MNRIVVTVYTTPLQKPSLNQLIHLPAFADHLLHHKIEDFIRYQLQLGYELDVPLLRQLAHLSEEQLLEISRQSSSELLQYLARNKAKEYIELAVERWVSNQLPLLDKNAVRAEDISLVLYIRKMAFVHFIRDFTANSDKLMELVKEIDFFIMQMELRTTNTYINMLKENIEQSGHFLQKVNDTVPGAVYVFDLLQMKSIFSNRKIEDVTGFSQQELNNDGNIIHTLVHPDDREELFNKIRTIRSSADKEIISYKYRLKTKDGSYRWMRNFETIFRRNHNGEATESIGISLDVDREHKAADALKENEKLYKRAEALTHIGSFFWNINSNRLKWSEELYRIYGLDPSRDDVTFPLASEMNHPDDVSRIREIIREAIAEKKTIDFYYRIITKDGTQKILHTKGEMVEAADGSSLSMIGTVQDVTEKQTLIRKLEHSESVHKQAEELTNMGSWTWDLATNKIDWSEQMYKIYEFDAPMDVKLFYSFIHPEDREKIETILQRLLKEKHSDHTFRIITRSGKIKTLHTIARVHTDKYGNPDYIVGAEQDITEKEQLLRQLQKTEQIYKQAEELANMGNWSWDVPSDTIEWTDQLYRIYGLEPQSEKITVGRFLELVHPEDRERIANGIEDFTTHDLIDDTFRIITPQGKVKILRSVAQVQRNREGKAIQVIGSERDITEKQMLIDQLKKSEALYKQAQMLTHVGNWTWDIRKDSLEWSDELYRIFGLEPGSEVMTYEKYLSFISEEDHGNLTATLEDAKQNGRPWELTHRIQRRNGETRIIFATGEVFTDPKGEAYLMIGTAQDITERQMLIEKLQESDRFFKQAQTIARLGSWSMDVKTREFSWSDEMYNIYEVEKGEFFDFDKWISHVPEDERDEILAYYEECLREKNIYDRIHKVRLHNGRIKTVHRKGEFILDAHGEPVKMIGTTQDITEEYRIQQELKENQTFIRKITDAAPSIIASYNIKSGKYVFVSEGLEKLLGYPTSELLNRGIQFFMEIIHPDDLQHVLEKNTRSIEEANADPSRNDLVVEMTYRLRHKNGEYRWIHTYGNIFDRDKQGKVEHVLNISLDVTEQVAATQTIKEQEHFIQQIADASPTILYLYDVENQSIAYINREIFFILGYAPEEVIEMEDQVTSLLYHPEDHILLPARKESKKNFQQVDSMMQYECRMKNRQGEWRWLLVREIVFKTDAGGNITQILGAALDINKRKEMEKTILQNAMLLEQSNASLEEFAYVASHDLKEPLRKISTFGDRLVTGQSDKLSPEGNLYLKKIIDASQRMQTMINDLLSISMITGNTAFEDYSLQKILDETLQTLEFKVEQQNAAIIADPLPVARIIPFQFRQLFQNLLSNSLKFVRPGTRPEIRISYEQVHPEEVHYYQLGKSDSYHKICFSDNGIGFENEYAGKIFAIFQRLHGRSEYEGSGIGLAICKKIVEHHGGVIFAEGREGQGALFTILLPA